MLLERKTLTYHHFGAPPSLSINLARILDCYKHKGDLGVIKQVTMIDLPVTTAEHTIHFLVSEGREDSIAAVKILMIGATAGKNQGGQNQLPKENRLGK